MATNTKKRVTYKEPKSYFNDAMRKAADDWEAANKGKKPATVKKEAGKKK